MEGPRNKKTDDGGEKAITIVMSLKCEEGSSVQLEIFSFHRI